MAFGWHILSSTLHGKTSLFRGFKEELLFRDLKGNLRESYVNCCRGVCKRVKNFICDMWTPFIKHTPQKRHWANKLSDCNSWYQVASIPRAETTGTWMAQPQWQGWWLYKVPPAWAPVYQGWSSYYCCQKPNLSGTELNTEPMYDMESPLQQKQMMAS